MTRRRLEVAALWVGTLIALGAGWTGIVTHIGIDRIDSGQAVFVSLCALAAPALATAMTARHPDEPTGPLLGLTVLATMLAACRTTDLGPVAQFAGVTALLAAPLPALVVSRYTALIFPLRAVRLVSRCFWAATALGVVLGLVLVIGRSVPTALWFTRSPGPVGDLTKLLLILHSALVCTGPLVLAGTSVVRRMPRASRVAARPIMWPVAGWALALTASEVWAVACTFGSPTRDLSFVLDSTLFVILPAFLVGALAAGIGWVDLTVRIPTSLAGTPAPRTSTVNVEQYLSRALADPSIRVRYPVDGAQTWVSAAGSSASLETGTADRATTVIVRGSRLIGLIDQDAATTAHPDAVEIVATGAGLIMETERLRASAASDLEQARTLAERLLVASDEPRSALRTTLVNGPLAELDRVAQALAGGTPMADVVARLTAVAADVRAISHGVLSASLATGGLRASLGGHLVPDRRYAPVIEMTTYLAAQADPTATVEETMGEDGPCLVILTSPAPADDVRDRVTALGGTVSSHGPGWVIRLPTETGPDHP
ncbi:hypothetical protein BA895_16490 [Humibacillus sp. DSM 29435]|uniref:hypothetical protein n=1 Tax=Humibacillus sp. DSM 29435 TaxID=1869167 RepID=UPI00087314B1|nr:hypothetical protein [Humibacillus sp. DSM 29435]OFE17378.1 hypothetical protein BA895_16490 [Humibacillus sp. DSM 29435]